MATIPQQLIDMAERAVKSGAKSGKECAAFTRKHAPDLAKSYISHLFLAFKMVKKAAQFGPAIEAAKAGKPGTLAQLAKPYQGAGKGPSGSATGRSVSKAPALGAPYGASLDDDLAAALGLGLGDATRTSEAIREVARKRRRNDPPPHINPDLYEQFAAAVGAQARKAGRKDE